MVTTRMLLLVLSALVITACSGAALPTRHDAYYAGPTCPVETVAICDVHSLAGCRCTLLVAD